MVFGVVAIHAQSLLVFAFGFWGGVWGGFGLFCFWFWVAFGGFLRPNPRLLDTFGGFLVGFWFSRGLGVGLVLGWLLDLVFSCFFWGGH